LARRPAAVAITGGIGAGKSEALHAFERHGAATISADDIVHSLIHDDREVYRAMVDRFGEDILDEEGVIDRRRVAQIVFADREQLLWLEGLLHPLVSREYLHWRERLAELPDPPAVCVTEVPLLYESGGETRFDAVVVITAPTDLREERARVEDLEERSARLLPDEEKVARADFAYVNAGDLDALDAWVVGVLEQLAARAPTAG
jgi:dephospho-CoA kinase